MIIGIMLLSLLLNLILFGCYWSSVYKMLCYSRLLCFLQHDFTTFSQYTYLCFITDSKGTYNSMQKEPPDTATASHYSIANCHDDLLDKLRDLSLAPVPAMGML